MSTEPVRQELDITGLDTREQKALEAIARLHAERLELQRDGHIKKQPGATEAEALTTVALDAFIWGCVGTALGGAALGTLPFPIVGRVIGLTFAFISGIVPCLVAALLYAASRGRVSPKFAMTWAGSAAGVGCFATLMTHDFYWAPCVVAGVFGAFGARLATRRALRRYELSEGLGLRPLRQFSIFDLMLLTSWLAMVLTILQLATRLTGWPWSRIFTCVAISLVCAGAIEAIAQMVGATKTGDRR